MFFSCFELVHLLLSTVFLQPSQRMAFHTVPGYAVHLSRVLKSSPCVQVW